MLSYKNLSYENIFITFKYTLFFFTLLFFLGTNIRGTIFSGQLLSHPSHPPQLRACNVWHICEHVIVCDVEEPDIKRAEPPQVVCGIPPQMSLITLSHIESFIIIYLVICGAIKGFNLNLQNLRRYKTNDALWFFFSCVDLIQNVFIL